MKTKQFTQKLTLNKTTMAVLNQDEMKKVDGGQFSIGCSPTLFALCQTHFLSCPICPEQV